MIDRALALLKRFKSRFRIASTQEIGHDHGVVWEQRDSLETRASLIARMKDWQDQASWQDFFDTYWKLIYGVARKAGLSDGEAQDVVQETMVSVARHIPNFEYDASRGSFKGWLLNMTRWRIVDQMRKRGPAQAHRAPDTGDNSNELVQDLPDPASLLTDQTWEIDWQKNLVEAALARLRPRVDPQKFQLFDFYVNKEWPPEKVAERFGVTIEQVYAAKHRLTTLLKAEVRRLEEKTR